MDAAIEKLLKVQDKDTRLANLKKTLTNVPKERAKIEEDMASAEGMMDAAKKAIQDIEKVIKATELEIAAANQKKNDLLAKSSSIRKNDEYRAMLHEVEAFDQQISGLEEQELTQMESLETAKAQRQEAKKMCEAAKSRLQGTLQDLEVREKNCLEQVDKVKTERDAMVKDVPRDLLRLYERLVKKSTANGTTVSGVAPLVDDFCGSCRLRVTPQVRHKVLKDEIVTCENCGVILYSPGNE